MAGWIEDHGREGEWLRRVVRRRRAVEGDAPQQRGDAGSELNDRERLAEIVGYLADGVTPGPLLAGALDYINSKVGAPDGPIMDALNAAWATAHPAASAPLVAFSINDDSMMIWLNDRSDAATSFAKNFLLNHSGVGNDINGNPKAYTASGLRTVFAGSDAAAYLHVAVGDSRVPDVFGISQYGSVYTGGHGKIAEHGGANPQDRNVPIVVSGAGVDHSVSDTWVETTQIAPTILRLLGLNPNALEAVQIEHTQALQIGG